MEKNHFNINKAPEDINGGSSDQELFNDFLSSLPFEKAAPDLSEKVINELNHPKPVRISLWEKIFWVFTIIISAGLVITLAGYIIGKQDGNSATQGNTTIYLFGMFAITSIISLLFIRHLLSTRAKIRSEETPPTSAK